MHRRRHLSLYAAFPVSPCTVTGSRGSCERGRTPHLLAPCAAPAGCPAPRSLACAAPACRCAPTALRLSAFPAPAPRAGSCAAGAPHPSASSALAPPAGCRARRASAPGFPSHPGPSSHMPPWLHGAPPCRRLGRSRRARNRRRGACGHLRAPAPAAPRLRLWPCRGCGRAPERHLMPARAPRPRHAALRRGRSPGAAPARCCTHACAPWRPAQGCAGGAARSAAGHPAAHGTARLAALAPCYALAARAGCGRGHGGRLAAGRVVGCRRQRCRDAARHGLGELLLCAACQRDCRRLGCCACLAPSVRAQAGQTCCGCAPARWAGGNQVTRAALAPGYTARRACLRRCSMRQGCAAKRSMWVVPSLRAWPHARGLLCWATAGPAALYACTRLRHWRPPWRLQRTQGAIIRVYATIRQP